MYSSGNYDVELKVEKRRYPAKKKQPAKFIDSFDKPKPVGSKYPRLITETSLMAGKWKNLDTHKPVYVPDKRFGHCLAIMQRESERSRHLAIVVLDLFKSPHALKDEELRIYEIKDTSNKKKGTNTKEGEGGSAQDDEDQEGWEEPEKIQKRDPKDLGIVLPDLMFYYLGDEDIEQTSINSSVRASHIKGNLAKTGREEIEKLTTATTTTSESSTEKCPEAQCLSESEHPNMKLLKAANISARKVKKSIESDTLNGEMKYVSHSSLQSVQIGKKASNVGKEVRPDIYYNPSNNVVEESYSRLELGEDEAALITSTGKIVKLTWSDIRKKSRSKDGYQDVKEALDLLVRQHPRIALTKLSPQNYLSSKSQKSGENGGSK